MIDAPDRRIRNPCRNTTGTGNHPSRLFCKRANAVPVSRKTSGLFRSCARGMPPSRKARCARCGPAQISASAKMKLFCLIVLDTQKRRPHANITAALYSLGDC